MTSENKKKNINEEITKEDAANELERVMELKKAIVVYLKKHNLH